MKSHAFAGRRFAVRDQRTLPQGDLGECDWEKRTMAIPVDGDTLTDLDVTVHEAIHAAFPFIEEHYVEKGATDIARLLWRLGWRKDL